MLGKSATNDEAESCLGGTTAQVQRFERLALASAAAISDMRRNAFLHRPIKAKSDKKPRGIFHQFDEKLRLAIVMVAMEDAAETRAIHSEELALQAKARQEKEELAKQQNMEKATEEFIEACYLVGCIII